MPRTLWTVVAVAWPRTSARVRASVSYRSGVWLIRAMMTVSAWLVWVALIRVGSRSARSVAVGVVGRGAQAPQMNRWRGPVTIHGHESK